MVKRPDGFGRFEFAVMSGLRAAQLSRGCVPLVPVGTQKLTTTAQMEVAEYKVLRQWIAVIPMPVSVVLPAADSLVPAALAGIR
jgi:DNA-directed RNA polymerase subunit K/omega